jgi:hypothetical protein
MTPVGRTAKSALMFAAGPLAGQRAVCEKLQVLALAFRGAAKPGWRPDFSRHPGFETNFSGLTAPCLRATKPGRIRANCVNDLVRFNDGGLKRRLQARLPAPPLAVERIDAGQLHAMNGESRERVQGDPRRPGGPPHKTALVLAILLAALPLSAQTGENVLLVVNRKERSFPPDWGLLPASALRAGGECLLPGQHRRRRDRLAYFQKSIEAAGGQLPDQGRSAGEGAVHRAHRGNSAQDRGERKERWRWPSRVRWIPN